MSTSTRFVATTSSVLFLAAACGPAELSFNPAAGGGGEGAGSGTGGDGGQGLILPNTTNTGGAGGSDPCDSVNCPSDQRCEAGQCVNNTCADLNCSPTEECVTTSGGGAECVDIGCTDDFQCPPDRYCDGTICVDDVCTPGDTSCVGQDLFECPSNGSPEVLKFTCNSPTSYVSQCIDDMMGNAFCSCRDDWDCPANASCEGGACTGSGQNPTCFLAPEPFTNVLPQPEIVWGGVQGATQAVGSPFPDSAQVVQAPVVANLDDDNGDGLINDLDVPEIIFTTYCGNSFTANGVLRAIHGGPPAVKGLDYFATNGSTTWKEGDPSFPVESCNNAQLDSTSSLAVGDLDDDGVPEIVAVTEGNGIQIFSHEGDLISDSGDLNVGGNPGPTLANLDGQGLAEIVIGRRVFTLEIDAMGDLQVLDVFQGNLNQGSNGQGPVSCIADVTGDGRPEIVAGTTAYNFPMPPAGVTAQSQCTGSESAAEEVAFCNGDLLVAWNSSSLSTWTGGDDEGFCAIADVLGANQTVAPGPGNPLDDLPEVIVQSNGALYVLNGQTGDRILNLNPSAGQRGGPPNVDDFDGDGFPEIGTAYETSYIVFDLQDPSASCPLWPNKPANDSLSVASANAARTPPSVACTTDSQCSAMAAGTACNEATNQCVCLHNGWRRDTEDDSSRVTGSSVFDFNGDGAAEVIYNDECRFRLYDGLDGTVYLSEPSESRTRIEYPIVVDVDNDGNAEIVFATTNESGFCSENLDTQYNNGIEVWSDTGDFWVSARRIWNQHAYSVTGITESGAIPAETIDAWDQYNGREYNIFRSNPRTLGIAPDLTVVGVQVTSPDATCGQLSNLLDITVEVRNQGDLRVGPGVVIAFDGTWTTPTLQEPLFADAVMTPLTFVLQSSLEPGQSAFFSVPYDAANNMPMTLPDQITVTVDATTLERECDETNNAFTEPVVAGGLEADLRVVLGAPTTSPCPVVPTTVFNDGSAPASNVVVRYFAGDPGQGGTAIDDELIAGPIAAGTSISFDKNLVSTFPQGFNVEIWAVVDPDNAIFECNDGNNDDAAPNKVTCGGIR
ncbi:MAG: FG-GAP-like repeat-containing protein [Myxococcota bacterium]